jgi:transcription elongation factor Elf1
MASTYTITLHCGNCGDVTDYEIDKGMRVSGVDCQNCGVKALARQDWTTRPKNKYFKEEDDA